MPYKTNSYKKIDKNLITLINILKEHKINYWICHGTLLGIIRDKELIPWDLDIDIGVIENKITRMTLPIMLKKKGFKEVKKTFLKNDGMLKFIKEGGREVDINFYQIDRENKTAYVKWYIPKNLLMRTIDALSFAKNYKGNFSKIINFFGFSEKFFLKLKKNLVINSLFYSHAGYSHKKEYALKLKYYDFCGLKINVPEDFKSYLEDLYGKNWRIPIKNYNWIKHSPSTILLNKND